MILVVFVHLNVISLSTPLTNRKKEHREQIKDQNEKKHQIKTKKKIRKRRRIIGGKKPGRKKEEKEATP